MRKTREEICKKCGKNYSVEQWRKPSSYCSNDCKRKQASTWLLNTSFNIGKANEQQKLDRLKQNFDKFVNRKSDCWDWTGRIEKGYPKLSCRKGLGANFGHRASWIIYYGEIPPGKSVLHKCDNPKCTNPDHLFLGTNADNINDMLIKQRNPKGSKVGTAKLNESNVLEIKKKLACGEKLVDIAKKYCVTIQAISMIKRNKNWKHIGAE
jgi:hypothetical protein